jgi:hypothetical protein
MTETRRTKQTRDELRATLLTAGQEIVREEGLETGSNNLTFKRVFQRIEDDTGVRITNASVIRRVWENQADFQADVLVAIAQDEGRPEADLVIQAVTRFLDDLDLSSAPARARALQELCRLGGAASSEAIADSSHWTLWISVVAMATTLADSERRRRMQSALLDGYAAVTKFWEETYGLLMPTFGLRIRRPWTMRQFTMAVTAYGEGCSLRDRIDGHSEVITRPTGPGGADQEWTLFAVGLEALVHQFFEVVPQAGPSGDGGDGPPTTGEHPVQGLDPVASWSVG